VSLIQVESNLLGVESNDGLNVGSGGWSNIIAKFIKAKEYCDRPFETLGRGGKKTTVYTDSEWIGESKNGAVQRKVRINWGDSCGEKLKPESLDIVLTDPPYFGNVQYAELMDFCYVWLRKLVGESDLAFQLPSTRSVSELTGNNTENRGLAHFTEGLSKVFCSMASALKRNAPLAFTYHHNAMVAYHAVGVALLDSRLPCTATLPCPAEMGGSIHINGTGSSIIDTVFVCRKGAKLPDVPPDLAAAVLRATKNDVSALAKAGYRATRGDTACIVNGHVTRLAAVKLYATWDVALPTENRLQRFGAAVAAIASAEKLKRVVDEASGACHVKEKTLFEL
jgi:hypothetical protein